MKKAIITIALLLVSLIPTYVLIFQAMRTAVPDATIHGIEVSPAFVRWNLRREGEEISETTTGEARANKKFKKTEPQKLDSLAEAASVTWEAEPDQVRIAIYNLTADNTFVGYATTEEVATHALNGTEDHLQVVIVADWKFTKIVSARAAYSFEVNG